MTIDDKRICRDYYCPACRRFLSNPIAWFSWTQLMNKRPETASVIINTYNRAKYLRNAVASILGQTFPRVELIVVNGPSTDDTEEVLDKIEGDGISIKRARCSRRNLAISRNVGIACADGDVIFFIDDDGVAHREWVSRIMAAYDQDGLVGAVGGFTFDHTGTAFQCQYTVCDKFGNARNFSLVDPEGFLRSAGSFFFPSLLGTNSSFRRITLRRLGGFDETFEYMLDETDVCARMHDDGKRIVTVPNAYVFHKYAPSHTRSAERLPNSLLAPARSKAYFCMKHVPKSRNIVFDTDVMAELDRYQKDITFSNKWFLDHRKITPAHYTQLMKELAQGLSEGIQAAANLHLETESPCSLGARGCAQPAFTPVHAINNASGVDRRGLRIYFVSQGYPPHDTSGIARWTSECAHALHKLGHEVHVITTSLADANHIDFVDGIWIHSITDTPHTDIAPLNPLPLPDSVLSRAEAVYREIVRSEVVWGVDVVSAPIWDVEGIICCAQLKKPVVTSLHTTYKLALPFKPEWHNNIAYRKKHVDKVISAEQWLLEHSPSILANSPQIVAEINSEYNNVLAIRSSRVTTILHGLGSSISRSQIDPVNGPPEHVARRLTILFVGRIEARKGPDHLLEALLHIADILDLVDVIFVGKPGNHDDPYQAKVTKLAESVNRMARRSAVTFTGYLPDSELEGHYARADIFVAPSRFESFGLVLIEAMRHSTPIIACNIGGMREIVTDGVEGYLVEVGNVTELADRLRKLITRDSDRIRMGNAALAKYTERFTATAMGDSLERFFVNVAREYTDA